MTDLNVAPHYDLKMLKAHYDDLKQGINISLHNRNVEQLVNQYQAAHLSYTRFAWDMIWVSVRREFVAQLYTYLKDEHVERAAKRALAELGVGAWS